MTAGLGRVAQGLERRQLGVALEQVRASRERLLRHQRARLLLGGPIWEQPHRDSTPVPLRPPARSMVWDQPNTTESLWGSPRCGTVPVTLIMPVWTANPRLQLCTR